MTNSESEQETLSEEERRAFEKRAANRAKPPIVDAVFDDGDLHLHELAATFPRMATEAFDELVSDIDRHGIKTPITLYQGKILDGCHRHLACKKLGITCPSVEFTDDDPVAFVISMNLRRRHLSTAQRAVIAAGIATLEKGSNQHLQNCRPTIEEAAKALHVSERSVASAKRVLKNGTPELVEALRSGEVPLAEAERIARLHKTQQAAATKAKKVRKPPTKATGLPTELSHFPWMRVCAAIDRIVAEATETDIEPVLKNALWHCLNQLADGAKNPEEKEKLLREIEWECKLRRGQAVSEKKEEA